MIKVLAHGNKYDWAVCPECGCIFEYSTEDVHESQPSTIGLIAGEVFNKEVRCPECGYRIPVRKK